MFGDPISRPTVADVGLAIYESHVPSIDEGWTRWVMDDHVWTLSSAPYTTGKLKYQSLTDRNIKAGIPGKYKTIIIPDQTRAAILNGYRAGTMPPEYTGGLGAEGVK